RPRAAAAHPSPERAVVGLVAIQSADRRHRAEPAHALDRGDARLRLPAVAAPRGLLRQLATEHRSTGRSRRSQSDRRPGHHIQSGEGPLMEETRSHALDYTSVFRRRKWWLIVPIATSVVVGVALVRFLPKQYRAATTLGVTAPMVSPALVNQ